MKKINQLKTFLILLFFVLGISLNAQDKEVKNKIADLNGKVEKVTIKVDGKDVVFEGKEAERIAAMAKATSGKKIVQGFKIDEADLAHSGKLKEVEGFKLEEFDWTAKEDQKKVKVEIKNGKKSVTVTTNKDGKEETKTYEGDEAEKFLSKDAGDGGVKVIMKKIGGDDECENEDHMVFFEKEIDKDGCTCCCKNSFKNASKNHMKMMHGGKGNVKIMKGGKGSMMWKMKNDESDEKEVRVIIEKKKDLKETKETKKEEKK